METVLSVSGLVFVLLLGLLVRLVPPSTLQPNRGEPRATPRTSSVMATFMLVPRGEVRPNGSGKTTLLNLIPRFVDVTEGGVRLDDQDVRDLVPDDLWASIGLVPNAKASDFRARGRRLIDYLASRLPDGSAKADAVATLRAKGDDRVASMAQAMGLWPGEGIDFNALGLPAAAHLRGRGRRSQVRSELARPP